MQNNHDSSNYKMVYIEQEFINDDHSDKKLENSDDFDLMDVSIYSDVVSNSHTLTVSDKEKKCIHVNNLKMFHNKEDDQKIHYVIMINCHDTECYLKSDFVLSCLVGLKKSTLLKSLNSDMDMSWIESFTDVSIQADENGVDKMKRTHTNKTVHMMLLSLSLNKYNDDVNIVDKVKTLRAGTKGCCCVTYIMICDRK